MAIKKYDDQMGVARPARINTKKPRITPSWMGEQALLKQLPVQRPKEPTTDNPALDPVKARNQRMNKEIAGRVKKMPGAARAGLKPKKIQPVARKVANDMTKQAKDMANMFKPK